MLVRLSRTLSGQEPEDLDKTRYDYTGDVIPIFKTGYSREWRELLGMQSEGFDPLLDDQANVTFNLRSDMAQYLLTGDQTLNVNGVYTGYGITNHPNTIQVKLDDGGGINIDLQTATPDEIVTFFNQDFQAILDAQNVFEQVTLWVSRQCAAASCVRILMLLALKVAPLSSTSLSSAMVASVRLAPTSC